MFCFVFLIDEGYYQGGKFQFETEVPDAYNMVVSRLRLSHRSPFAWPGGHHPPPALGPPSPGAKYRLADISVINVTVGSILRQRREINFSTSTCECCVSGSAHWGYSSAESGTAVPRLTPLLGAACVVHTSLIC